MSRSQALPIYAIVVPSDHLRERPMRPEKGYSSLRPTNARLGGATKAEGRRSTREPKFYTIGAVAEMLDVSVRTVRRWSVRGELIAHQIGGVVRIAEADLENFLARHRLD